ncbi:Uncharacterized protein PBTT_00056 [Plasmodiophora brassicae]
MMHPRAQCCRELMRQLAGKKAKAGAAVQVETRIETGLQPTIKVEFTSGGSLDIDATTTNVKDVFVQIREDIERTENWNSTELFKPILQAGGYIP